MRSQTALPGTRPKEHGTRPLQLSPRSFLESVRGSSRRQDQDQDQDPVKEPHRQKERVRSCSRRPGDVTGGKLAPDVDRMDSPLSSSSFQSVQRLPSPTNLLRPRSPQRPPSVPLIVLSPERHTASAWDATTSAWWLKDPAYPKPPQDDASEQLTKPSPLFLLEHDRSSQDRQLTGEPAPGY